MILDGKQWSYIWFLFVLSPLGAIAKGDLLGPGESCGGNVYVILSAHEFNCLRIAALGWAAAKVLLALLLLLSRDIIIRCMTTEKNDQKSIHISVLTFAIVTTTRKIESRRHRSLSFFALSIALWPTKVAWGDDQTTYARMQL